MANTVMINIKDFQMSQSLAQHNLYIVDMSLNKQKRQTKATIKTDIIRYHLELRKRDLSYIHI